MKHVFAQVYLGFGSSFLASAEIVLGVSIWLER